MGLQILMPCCSGNYLFQSELEKNTVAGHCVVLFRASTSAQGKPIVSFGALHRSLPKKKEKKCFTVDNLKNHSFL